MLLPTELLTDVAAMDEQHDHLFEEIQRVKNILLAVQNNDGPGMVLLTRFVEEMAEHFDWEETAARNHGIPFETHAREHARIMAFLRGKLREIDEGDCNIPALMVFVERQFESHVAHHDLALGQALRAAVK